MREKKGNAAVVFRLKEKICGKKKSNIEPTAILHPSKKDQVTDKKEITKICGDYCENLLKKKEPKEDFKLYLELK